MTVAGPGLCLGRDALGEAELVGRIDFRGGPDELSRNQPGEDYPEQLEGQPQDLDGDARSDQYQDSGAEYAGAQGPEEAPHVCAFLRSHQEGAQDRGYDAHGGYEDWQGEHRRVEIGLEVADVVQLQEGCARRGQGDRGDYGADVGLEEVSAHARNVAHVVANVVGDGGRVARVVLGDARLDLAHEVCAHIRGLGVYAAANPGEQGYGGCAEPEAGNDAHVPEDQVYGRHSDQADAYDRDAHDRATVECDPQGGVQALLGLDDGAGVGPDGDAHADKACEPGPYCAHQVCNGRSGHGSAVVRIYPAQQVVVDEGCQHGEDDDYEYRQEPVLPREEGHGALLYGAANELDGLVALVLPEDVEREQQCEYEPDRCGREGQDEDDHSSLSMKKPPHGGRP